MVHADWESGSLAAVGDLMELTIDGLLLDVLYCVICLLIKLGTPLTFTSEAYFIMSPGFCI